MYILFCVFSVIVSFCVLFVCKCILYCCQPNYSVQIYHIIFICTDSVYSVHKYKLQNCSCNQFQ